MLKTQGGEKYQQAFYVFEELAQAPSTSSVRSLVSQAVAELHLGRTEEAQAALDQALKKEPGFAEAIANLLVLAIVTGADATELMRYVAFPFSLWSSKTPPPFSWPGQILVTHGG
jgi:Flp pilus assembly protein TadD